MPMAGMRTLGRHVAALVLAILWWRQESMLFYPVPLPADYPLANAPDIRERFEH